VKPAVQARCRPAPGATGFTDQSAWGKLSQAQSLEECVAPWLTLVAAAIDGVTAAVAFVDLRAGGSISAAWPEGVVERSLGAAVDAARARQRGVLEETADGGFTLAYPLLLGMQARGGVALLLEPRSPEDLHAAMRQLQWGAAWLRERLLADRLDAIESEESAGRTVLDLVAIALEPAGFRASAGAVATELARRFDCERVSFGVVKSRGVRVAAISHSASFGKDMNLVRLIGEVMDEAVDQRAIIVHPAPADELNATRAHGALAAAHGAGAILTLPMHMRDGLIGALTLERGPGRTFGSNEAAILDLTATALAPILEEKRLNDSNILVKAADAMALQAKRLLGPGFALRKAAILGAVAVCTLFWFWRDTYRVTADALVEGRIQRSVVVGFNGFLREAPARPGDIVKAGDTLAALDDRELALERLRWVTERQRRAFEYEKALGERNRGETRIAANLMEQAEAQIQLVDAQLERAKLTAPFDGVVVSGDHSQSIGAAVQRGQVLFEVAPTDGHRVMLSVDEAQIGAIREGQKGHLVLAALPGNNFPVEIVRVTPVARAEEGRNLFRVEARPTGSTEVFRPGMRGAAKIDVDERRVIWIWTRTFMDWLRLALWRWAP
jgi:multidrug resistance efflux pump